MSRVLVRESHELDPGPRAVAGKRVAGVASGDVGGGRDAELPQDGDLDRVAAVLERAGWVQVFELGGEVVDLELPADGGQRDDRCFAFTEGHQSIRIPHGKQRCVPPDPVRIFHHAKLGHRGDVVFDMEQALAALAVEAIVQRIVTICASRAD